MNYICIVINEYNLMKKYVAYYRVSLKDEQKQKGLGLLSQRTIVHQYAENNNAEIIYEFSERESGRKNDRVELNKALNACKENNATLIIAKIDRLSRNVSFVFALRDSNVDFLACDLMEFNTLTLAIFVAMAQQERELISNRTSSALKELKRKGVKLGTSENLIQNMDRAIFNSIKTRREKALCNENNQKSYTVIQLLRGNDVSLNKCASYLNAKGFLTSSGRKHTAMSVKNLIALYE